MPVNYSDSKIFCIKSFETDKIYIGSTVKRLPQRLATLKDSYKKYMNGSKVKYDDSFYILQYNDAYIQLLESCDVKNKDELNSKLIETIERYKNKVVNGQNKKETSKPKQLKDIIINDISENSETISEEDTIEIVETKINDVLPSCYSLPVMS